jgi:ribose 5-phosphate isomerase A
MDDAKRMAARAALDEIPDAGTIGLGTGSTARLFVEELAALLQGRQGSPIVGVPTSDATRAQATSLGIPLLPDEGPWQIVVNVDGADEVSETLDLIKGGGGAHAREKIINYASARNVVIVDASKMSRRLGERFAVPVEVLPFGHKTTQGHLCELGTPILRMRGATPFRTDAGNFIYDLATGPIADAPKLDIALRQIPGIVETGLFIGRADLVIVADQRGIVRLERAKDGVSPARRGVVGT